MKTKINMLKYKISIWILFKQINYLNKRLDYFESHESVSFNELLFNFYLNTAYSNYKRLFDKRNMLMDREKQQ